MWTSGQGSSENFISLHRRSCYRDNGDKSPPWQGKELVYQEPESIEVLILIQGISSWCLEGYHFQINACPCLLLYERHFKPACLGLAVCLLQAVIISNKYFLSDWYHFSSLNMYAYVNPYQSYYYMFFLSKIYIRDVDVVFPAHSSIHATFPTVNWCHTLLSQRLYVPNAVLISIRNQKK